MTAPWWAGPMLALDTETTGPNPDTARLVSVTADLYKPGSDDAASTMRLIVNPGVPIPAEAAEVHGITDERAQDEGIAPADAVVQTIHRIEAAWSRGIPVVAYNAAFDLTVLAGEAMRHLNSVVTVSGPVIDPMVLDKAADPYVKGANQRRLGPTCERYGITVVDWHDATADARAAALIARAIGAKHAAKLPANLRDLWTYQKRARRAQAESLTSYFERVGKTNDDGTPIVVDTAWPMRELVPA
ncbi:exonuclease domain-containing protein [Cellulosimicrobium funkei]|uniref:exonuclease domain-containing protein n=1 Tax=Cellulosimicrobium funkei TaxID=264251 RepID=UPI0034195970